MITKPQQVRHFVPAPGKAVLTTEYRTRESGVWLPDTAVVAEAHGTVLGIGALKGCDIPLQMGDTVTYAPYTAQDFDLGDGTFTIIAVRDILTIADSGQRVALLYDYRLPTGSVAGERLAWLAPGHVLIRPYSPVGFKTVPGTDKTIWVERNERHPKIWAHVLAIRHDDWKRLHVYPGDMVIFARYSEEVLAHERPLQARHRTKLAIAVTHVDNLQAVAQGRDVPKPEF